MNGHVKVNGRMRPRRRIDFRRPSFSSFYWLGVEASRGLDARATWSDIGRSVCLSKQNAYTAGMVALGKVVYELRKLHDAVA